MDAAAIEDKRKLPKEWNVAVHSSSPLLWDNSKRVRAAIATFSGDTDIPRRGCRCEALIGGYWPKFPQPSGITEMVLHSGRLLSSGEKRSVFSVSGPRQTVAFKCYTLYVDSEPQE